MEGVSDNVAEGGCDGAPVGVDESAVEGTALGK